MNKDKVVEILKELWRYEKTNKYTDEEIRQALDIAIEQLGGKW